MPIETLINAVKHWAEWTFATRGELKRVASSESVEAIESNVSAIESSIEAVESQIESMKPDWNAKEGEDGHIANRTHYNDKSVVLESTSFNVFGGYTFVSETIVFVKDTTYNVVFDGVLYECVAYAGNNNAIVIGNGDIWGGGSGGKGEPFSCDSYEGDGCFLNTNQDGTHEIEIYTGGIKKLSEEYLPDSVAFVADLEALDSRLSAIESTPNAEGVAF